MIDVTKPLRLKDGTPVEYNGGLGHEHLLSVKVDGYTALFDPRGKHLFKHFADLENEPGPRFREFRFPDGRTAFVDPATVQAVYDQASVVEGSPSCVIAFGTAALVVPYTAAQALEILA